MDATTQRPRIALTVGDPAGIGPEIVRALLEREEIVEPLRLVVLGPARECPPQLAPCTREVEFAGGESPQWFATDAPEDWEMGRAQRASGLAALAALRKGAELAQRGEVDALVTAPVCKEALHLAGEAVEGQTELLARWARCETYQMVGVAGSLRVMLLTRHLPLVEALKAVSAERVLAHLELFDRSLRALGCEAPRLALAGLNPHAGENALLGFEEVELLEPAVQAARARGLRVEGPLPPDTVFLRASQGAFDGVLALYHDQAFIPLKLLSAGRGLTWIAGLPYLRLSPVHGTAFDIAGQGLAAPDNLAHALRTAGEWVRRGRRGASEGTPFRAASAGAW